uniref:Transposase IS30-like HTH domain-containing protein n=1 Tax=Globisporangium ultimum (strain ATCC 200006 / CBS 805.95 / DAOM BR144) TaxID=431595 RepID=K3WTL9_GLOUD
MPAGTPLIEEERLSILTLREAGLSVRAISAAVKRSVGVCQKVIKDGKASRKSNHRCGKLKLTERDYRCIVRGACGGSVGAKAIKNKLQLDCCVRTIQRVLSDVDWFAYKKRPAAPLIQPHHQKAR